MKTAFEATISGRVQMVMYRDFAVQRARTLGVFGEVKNLENGTVFVHAEGERVKLEELITFLNKGPMFAQVEEMKIEWIEPLGQYSDFSITY